MAWISRSRDSVLGFGLSFVLLFLILVAQFRSWVDPFLIMLAIPMGFIGVLIILPLTHTTLNVMSLVGVLMLIGIADSNSILIVDFAHKLEEQGMSAADAVINSCRVRLRPILMTSLATIIGLAPHGAETRHWRRTIYANGPRYYRRPHFFGSADDLHRSGRVPTRLWKKETQNRAGSLTPDFRYWF